MTTFPFSLEIAKKDKITSISLRATPSSCTSETEKAVINAWLNKSTNIESLIDLDKISEFQKKVLLHLRTLKHNETTTYSEIAKAIGHPGAARAVGSALAKNPYLLIFPCHKAIRRDGGLGNFSCQATSREDAINLKKSLIQYEGQYNEQRT